MPRYGIAPCRFGVASHRHRASNPWKTLPSRPACVVETCAAFCAARTTVKMRINNGRNANFTPGSRPATKPLTSNQTFPNGAAEKPTQKNKPSLAAQWEKSYLFGVFLPPCRPVFARDAALGGVWVKGQLIKIYHVGQFLISLRHPEFPPRNAIILRIFEGQYECRKPFSADVLFV